MSGEIDPFVYIMWTILFYAALWFSGVLFELIGGAGLVAEIIIGLLLGPSLLNIVPEPEAIMLYGEIGLMLLLLEAGLTIDIDMLKKIGVRGFLVGIIGTLMPLALGTGLAYAMGYNDFRTALAAGCALAPTSPGITIEIFKSMGVLSSPVGQLVTTAAVVDDVVSLVILSVLQTLVVEDSSPREYILPIISSILYLGILGGLSIFIPKLISKISKNPLRRIPPQYHKSIALLVVLCYGTALAAACHYSKSSYLLGVFLAGLAFCRVHIIHDHWKKQVAPVLKWLLRAFFAGTIAFQIPKLEVYSDPSVIGLGFVLFIAVIGKLATGFFVVPLNVLGFFKVGVAMSTWGEIAFLIATISRTSGLMDEKLSAALIFAVLLSALISPFVLRFILMREKKMILKEQKKEEKEREADGFEYWLVIINCNVQWGLLGPLSKTISSIFLEIVEAKSETGQLSGKVKSQIILKDKGQNENNRGQVIKNLISKCIDDPNPELIISKCLPGEFLQVDKTEEGFMKQSGPVDQIEMERMGASTSQL